jgi:hypothetical protein
LWTALRLSTLLKIPGAWWKIENADKMLALRVTRANGNRKNYWDSLNAA